MSRRIHPTRSRLEFRLLTQRDLEQIFEGALEVMQTVGVQFPSSKALDILEKGGCIVDRRSQVAQFPSKVTIRALKTAPKEFLLGARDPEADMWLDTKTTYLSTDGCCIEVYDRETGEKRRSTYQDIIDACRVADYLPEISYIWGPPCSAQDIPANVRPLYEMEAASIGCSKHIQTETVISEEMAQYVMEMGSILAGGREKMRQRPLLSFMQCAKDPLGQDTGSLEASMVAAEWGIPTGFMPMPSSVATAPATLAGNLVVTLVDMLSPLVLMQLLNPGTPIYFAAAPAAMDLYSAGYTGGGPEDYLLAAGSCEISRFLNIPMFIGAYATGAKEEDWQAALDNSLAGLMPVLTKGAAMNGAGTLDGSKIFSLQQLVMDTEIYRVIKKVSEGILVNKETLALDVIKEIGPGGNYLTHEHTLKNLDQIYQGRVLDRSTYEKWKATGKEGAYEKATALVKKILEEHEVEPIPTKVLEEWRTLMRKAEKEL